MIGYPAALPVGWVSALILLAARGLSAQESPPQPSHDVAGTYAISVCRNSCDLSSGRVFATGFIVIETQPYSSSEIPEPARSYFEKNEALLLRGFARSAPNACFALDGDSPESLVGGAAAGLTRWAKSSGDTITVRLVQSPDAGYDVRLTIASDSLSGSGGSYGPWDPSENSPPDVVLGHKIGPPDRTLCTRAAEQQLRQLQRP